MDTNVSAGNTYYYRVIAVNSAGQGVMSSESSVSLYVPPLDIWEIVGIATWIAVAVGVVAVLLISTLRKDRSVSKKDTLRSKKTYSDEKPETKSKPSDQTKKIEEISKIPPPKSNPLDSPFKKSANKPDGWE